MKGFLRYPCMIFAVGIGLCSIAATACFGLIFSQGPERYIYASIFGFLDASKLVLPSVASFALENGHKNGARIGVAIYLMLALLSGTAHVGLYATVKSEVIGGAGAAREKYDAAKAEKKALEADLANLGSVRPAGTIEAELSTKRLDARYTRSRGCSDVTVADSRALCAEVAALAGEKANALQVEKVKGKLEDADGRMRELDVAAALRSADPQAEQLASLTGFSQDSVRLWMAIILSVMIELGSSLLLDVAAVGKRVSPPNSADLPVQNSVQAAWITATPPEPADSSVEDWVRGALQTKRNGTTTCTAAREAYERGVRAAGGIPVSPNAFGRAMTGLGYKRKKKSGHFHYTGVVLAQTSLKVVA
ncbi:MAG: hypothetical protein ACLPPF_06485 [Rhodomicrobium sp.]